MTRRSATLRSRPAIRGGCGILSRLRSSRAFCRSHAAAVRLAGSTPGSATLLAITPRRLGRWVCRLIRDGRSSRSRSPEVKAHADHDEHERTRIAHREPRLSCDDGFRELMHLSFLVQKNSLSSSRGADQGRAITWRGNRPSLPAGDSGAAAAGSGMARGGMFRGETPSTGTGWASELAGG